MKKIKKLVYGFAAIIVIVGFSKFTHLSEGINILEKSNKEAEKNVSSQIDKTSDSNVSGVLTIDYIDVGQGAIRF